jgi:hypothetical protein
MRDHEVEAQHEFRLSWGQRAGGTSKQCGLRGPMAVSGVTTRRAAVLRASYYSLGYPRPYRHDYMVFVNLPDCSLVIMCTYSSV